MEGAGVDEQGEGDVDELADAASALYALMVAMLRQTPRDLSWTAASTLATVVRTGPRRVTDLAVLEAVAQPSMTAVVRRLESAGLVERKPDRADQRVVLVAPTQRGREYVRARVRAGTESIRQLIGKLPGEEVVSIVTAAPALQRLGDLCSEVQGDGRAPKAAGATGAGPGRAGQLARPPQSRAPSEAVASTLSAKARRRPAPARPSRSRLSGQRENEH